MNIGKDTFIVAGFENKLEIDVTSFDLAAAYNTAQLDLL